MRMSSSNSSLLGFLATLLRRLIHQAVGHGIGRCLLQPLGIIQLDILGLRLAVLGGHLAVFGIPFVLAVAQTEGVVLRDRVGLDSGHGLPLARLAAAGAGRGRVVLGGQLGRGVVDIVDVLMALLERDFAAVRSWRLGLRRPRRGSVDIGVSRLALGYSCC